MQKLADLGFIIEFPSELDYIKKGNITFTRDGYKETIPFCDFIEWWADNFGTAPMEDVAGTEVIAFRHDPTKDATVIIVFGYGVVLEDGANYDELALMITGTFDKSVMTVHDIRKVNKLCRV